MKVLVTGVGGQLGYDVVKRCEQSNIEVIGIDIADADITNEQEIKTYIGSVSPDVVVHCAAYTAVDRAEEERGTCYNINVLGTRYIAEACKTLDIKMVYISTDYVFDGTGQSPWKTEDVPNPINYYGETKYGGELEVTNLLSKYFIIRISWVFGINGNNFIKTMLRIGKEREEVNVVHDQIGSPTYTYDLAELIADMIQTEKYGIYHATNEEYCSWAEFAEMIFETAGMGVKVNKITTAEYPTKAIRPFNSMLNKDKLEQNGFKRLRRWEEAVREFVEKS